MSIVFINDHLFYVDQYQKVFTSGTLTSEVWDRFTDNFGNLTVIGRGMKVEEKKHDHKISNAENVKFDLLYEVRGGGDYFKYRDKIREKLTTYIQNTDYIVLRLPSNIGVIAANLCAKYNKKYFVEVVGCAFDSMWYFGNIQGKLLAPIIARKNKKTIKNASAVIYVTENYLQKRYPNFKRNVNASNVAIHTFDIDVLKQHLLFLTRDSSTKKIGMLGNISLPYKGYNVLFKALKRVEIDYQLLIAGGGDSRWILQLIAKYNLKEKVVLLGRINSRDEIYNFLDNLDLYVQPSLTEGLPRSVIEAMSRACPIIASNAGGIPELISPEFIYKMKDNKHLSKLVTKSLQSVETLKEQSKINFKNSKMYTFEEINRRRYDFFQEIKPVIKNR